MFIGRQSELKTLRDAYSENGFRMVILYGRRRVGKSYLLQHFFASLDTPVIAFQAIEHSKELSIEAFRNVILDVFPSSYDITLNTWAKCFSYLIDHVGEKKTIICIDEINYIFNEDNTFASQLQSEIDHRLGKQNVLLIVCGSSISSIEEELLDGNAPLYGRRNLSIRLEEFNYLQSSEFYPQYSNEDKIIAYSVFGGKGKNLASIDPNRSIKENIIKQILTPGGALADEIDLLLKDDFRDPTFYKEILYVMSLGNTTFNDIYTQTNVDTSKLAIYLNKLIDLKIVERKEMVSSRKKKDVRYTIQDNFFSFFFRFIYKRRNILNILITPEAFYDRFIQNDLLSFVGIKFESICEQYIIRKSYQGELFFVPLEYGKYYGKHKDGTTFDIDVLFSDETTAICGECKFTNKLFSMGDMNELLDNAKEINVQNIEYYAFVKKGVEEVVKEKFPNLHIVTLDDLYAL